MNICTNYVLLGNEAHDMSSATVDRLLPALDSPFDALDTLLTSGGALGLLTYLSGLFAGNAEVATLGVGVGVACVLVTLTFRSARGVVRALA
jgi:hypothetical protein